MARTKKTASSIDFTAVLYASILIFLAIWLLYCIYHYRHINLGQAYYIFETLLKQKLIVDDTRYLSVLTLLPTLALSKLFLSEGMQPFLIWINGVLLVSQHFISLFVSHKLLTNYNRQDLFIYPFVSFVGLSLLNMSWMSSQVHEISCLFWPILIYFCLAPESNKKIITTYIVYAAICVSHQSGIFNFLVLFLALFIKFVYQKRQSNQLSYIFLNYLGIVISAIVILIRIYLNHKHYPNDNESFLEFFINPKKFIHPSHSYLTLALVILILSFRWVRQRVGLIFFMFILYFAFQIDWSEQINYGEEAKLKVVQALLVPFVGLAFALDYFFLEKSNRNSLVNLLLILLFAVSFYTEFKLFIKWKNSKDHLVQIMENMKPGCIVLAHLGDESTLNSFDMLHPIEYNSVLLNPSRKIDKVVFRKRHERACQFGDNNVLPIHDFEGKVLRLIDIKFQKTYFDFQEVLFTK